MFFDQTSKSTLLQLLIASTVCALLSNPASAEGRKLFRWVDEQGHVHFSDVVPPSEAKQGRSELNEQGMTVRKIQRAKTADEIAEEKRQARVRAELERVAREQAAYDRNLLDTYSSAKALEMARDDKIASLQGQIGVTRGNIANLRTQLDNQMNRAAALERNGKPVPSNLQHDIAATQGQVQRSEDFILERKQEIEAVRTKFAKDIARYRELTAPAQAKDNGGG